jgi:hypothetical protein
MGAPVANIVFVIGSPVPAREVKPRYPRQAKREAWREQRAIPTVDREALRQQVERFREATKLQREQLRARGLAMLRAP